MRALHTEPAAPSNAADTATLHQLNRDYLHSFQHADVRRYEEILAEDFVNSRPDGAFMTRAEFLAQFARPVTISNLDADDVRIRVLGDFALIHAHMLYTNPDGTPGAGRYTDIYARRGGQWQCIAAHVTGGQWQRGAAHATRGGATPLAAQAAGTSSTPERSPMKAPKPEITADTGILELLNQDYMRAVQQGDVRRFEQILADDFLNSNTDGTLVDRAGFLAQIARPVTIAKLEAHDVIVRTLGDFAIIHARTTYTKSDGMPGAGRYTDVWARRGGRWLCVSAHVNRG